MESVVFTLFSSRNRKKNLPHTAVGVNQTILCVLHPSNRRLFGVTSNLLYNHVRGLVTQGIKEKEDFEAIEGRNE